MRKTISFAILVSALAITEILTTRVPLAQEGGDEICVNFANFTGIPPSGSSITIDGFQFHKLGGKDPQVSNDGIEFPDEGVDIVFPYAASSGTFEAVTKAHPVRVRVVDGTKISFSAFMIQPGAVTKHLFSGEAVTGLRFTEGGNEGFVCQICITGAVSQ